MSAFILHADTQVGEFHRRVVSTVAERARGEGRAVHFLGAWGFLHYAESAGMRWLEGDGGQARPGDLLVGAHYVSNGRMPPGIGARLAPFAAFTSPPAALGVHTMNPLRGAGFYSSLYGPLPFTVGPGPASGAAAFAFVR
jgi:hypothetical protein